MRLVRGAVRGMRTHTQANSSSSSSDNGSRKANRQSKSPRQIANLFCTSHKYSCKIVQMHLPRHNRQGKSPKQIAKANRQGKSPRQVAKASRQGKSPRRNDYTARAMTIQIISYNYAKNTYYTYNATHATIRYNSKKGVTR